MSLVISVLAVAIFVSVSVPMSVLAVAIFVSVAAFTSVFAVSIAVNTVPPDTAFALPSSTFPSGLKACKALYTAPPVTIPVLFSSTKPFAATLIALVSEMAIPSPAEYVTPPAVLMVYVSTPVSDVDFVTVTLLPWATLIRLRTAALPVSEILPKSTLALPVLRDEIELLIPVIDVLIVSIAVVCPLTVVCNVSMSPAFAAISSSAVDKRVSSASVTANTLPPLTRPVSPAAIVPVSNAVPHAVMFAALRLAASTFANVLSAVVFVYASVIPYSSRVVPAFALPATAVCSVSMSPAFAAISSSAAATFATNESAPTFTVAFNESTVVFKLPTVMEESASPSLTLSVILLGLVGVPVSVVPVSVALVNVAPSLFAYALNALYTVPPVTRPVSVSLTSPLLFTFSLPSVPIVRSLPVFTFNAPLANVSPAPAFTLMVLFWVSIKIPLPAV